MRLFSFAFALLWLGLMMTGSTIIPAHSVYAHTEPTCAYPNGRPVVISNNSNAEGRCTGSAYCNICKNCSRCEYCNNGGSCGVCAGGYSSKYTSKNRGGNYGNGAASARKYAPSTTPSSQKVLLPAIATVKAVRLNVRTGPGTEYAILGQLSAGDAVTVLETAGKSWVKVGIVVSGNNDTGTMEGYVFRKYLTFL